MSSSPWGKGKYRAVIYFSLSVFYFFKHYCCWTEGPAEVVRKRKVERSSGEKEVLCMCRAVVFQLPKIMAIRITASAVDPVPYAKDGCRARQLGPTMVARGLPSPLHHYPPSLCTTPLAKSHSSTKPTAMGKGRGWRSVWRSIRVSPIPGEVVDGQNIYWQFIYLFLNDFSVLSGDGHLRFYESSQHFCTTPSWLDHHIIQQPSPVYGDKPSCRERESYFYGEKCRRRARCSYPTIFFPAAL